MSEKEDPLVVAQEAWLLTQPILTMVAREIEKIPENRRNIATAFLAAQCATVLQRMTGETKETTLLNVSRAMDHVAKSRPAPKGSEQN
jgi:hypothetical protein